MYSESYFEKALVPKEVRTCRDLNAIREETAKEAKGENGKCDKMGNIKEKCNNTHQRCKR